MLLCLLSTGLRRDTMEIQQLEGITLNVFHQSHTLQSRWWDPDACFPGLPRRDICQIRWGRSSEAQSHSLSFSKEWVHIQNWMRMRDREQPGGFSLCQERTQAWNWSWGNSCRIQPCGSGSEVGQDARLPTSLEANPAVVPDGCLAAQTSLGLPQSWWDLGVTSPALCVGCRLAQVGCWASLSRAFRRCGQVWKFHMEHLWWPWSPPSPHKTLPHSWSIFSPGWDAGSVTQGVFKMLHIRRKCSRLFVCLFFLIWATNPGRVGTNADLDHIVGTPLLSPRGKVFSSPEMELESPPTPKSDSESFLLLNVSRNSLHPTADSLGYSHTEVSAHWDKLCAQILKSYKVTGSHCSGKSSL